MEPIDNVARTLEVLRREMARNLEKLRREGKLSSSVSPRTQPTPPRPLRNTVARAIKALDVNDPRFAEKASSSFIESVLLAEFGQNLVNDADFRHVMHQVGIAMLTDATLRADLQHLVQQLLKE